MKTSKELEIYIHMQVELIPYIPQREMSLEKKSILNVYLVVAQAYLISKKILIIQFSINSYKVQKQKMFLQEV